MSNPQSFTRMRQLIKQFDVDAVVATGDLSDLGSASETCSSSRWAPWTE